MPESSTTISVEANARKKIVFIDKGKIKTKIKEDKDAIDFIFATKHR
jgi:hypothetical protein